MKSAKVQPESIMIKVQEQQPSIQNFTKKKLINIQFQDIKYSVNCQNPSTNSYEWKQILKGVTGNCPGGQVTAILGGSGAGKTTLLNILACRVPINSQSRLSGKVLANNQEYNYKTFQNFSAYVMQNDVLMETMTPKEIFQFAAHLMYTDTETQNQKVIETIKAMKLERCQNSLIGGVSFKGISGGERKRTSIGFELVSNPTCIILDEPTSGLDSFTAFQIIFELQQLAKLQNRTVLFTIHSPSADIFQLFDQIMLLVGGKFIYQGPRKQLLNHFDAIGFPCPKTSNPMDYYLSIMQSQNQEEQTIQNLYLAYDEFCHQQILKDISQTQNENLQLRTKQTNIFHEIKHLCYRNILVFKRDPMQLKIKIIQTIFQGLLLGGVFWNIGNSGEKVTDILQIAGCLFFCTINLAISAILSIILTFPVEREVFLREESSKLYTIFSYFISKQLVEVPLNILLPVVQAIISYWMCSFSTTNEAILMHLFVSILIYLWAGGLGIVIGCIFNDLKALMGIAPYAVLPYILFSGFFANPKFFYSWTRWIQYISPITFSFEAISRIEFKDQVYDADPIELYDFKFGTWNCVYVLIGFSIFFRLIGLLALYILKSKQQ